VSVLVDTSVIIDVLRGQPAAVEVLTQARRAGPLHASEITRLETLAGMRAQEQAFTSQLLEVFVWHPLDRTISEAAGELGRKWLPSNRGIDSADLVIAATAQVLNLQLLTRNVKHFPMFPGLASPY
jgi:predicted nucleic acid-binding protein